MGFMTDEEQFIIATLDAPANQNVFAEYSKAIPVQKSIVKSFGSVAMGGGATSLQMFDLNDQALGWWFKDFGSGKFDIVVPDSSLLKTLNAAQLHIFPTAVTDAEIWIDGFPNLETIGVTAGSNTWQVAKLWITGNPKLNTVAAVGNGAGAGKAVPDVKIWNNENITTINLSGNVSLADFGLGVSMGAPEAPQTLTTINLGGCTALPDLPIAQIPTHSAPGTGTLTVTGCTTLLGDPNWTGGENWKGQIEAKNWTVVDS